MSPAANCCSSSIPSYIFFLYRVLRGQEGIGYMFEQAAESGQQKTLSRERSGFANWLAGESYARTTLDAWKPFGPFCKSNSTVSPSFKVRYPFSWMAEK